MSGFRAALNEETRALFDRNFRAALAGTTDARQAESIARERTLFAVMRTSAATAYVRQRLMGEISAAPRRDFGFTQDYD